MELKRIVGPDVRTALRLVREQLGPDAMILSNRRVPAGIEIVAVPETQSAAGREMPSAYGRAERPEPVSEGEVPVPVQLRELQAEMQSMRVLLDHGLAELRSARNAIGPGIDGRIWQRLTRMGIPNGLVRELVAQLPPTAGFDAGWELMLSRLAAGVGSAGDVVARGGVWACAGPTGAGKTTMVCKLAVRHALEHGTDGLALISTDCTRIGGADMLRTVARLLGVPLLTARAGDSLQALLEQVTGARLVLVDTAGLSRRSVLAARLVTELGELRTSVGTLLVLPATAQYACLQAAVRNYGSCHPVAAVVTRLDEATSLGEIIGVLTHARLPLAYASDGPDVPEDLQLGVAAELVARAAMLELQAEAAQDDAVTAFAPGGFIAGADISDAARIAR